MYQTKIYKSWDKVLVFNEMFAATTELILIFDWNFNHMINGLFKAVIP